MNTRTTTTTFHKRYLPDQTTAFSSAEGRLRFVRSLHEGLAEPYFALAEQFRTQDEPAFCGLATLVMCLNAMAIDPGRVWKGVWRWFSEDMLSCCKSLDQVKDEGISLSEFARLARCNGANCDVTRGHAVTVDDFRSQVKENCSRKACHSPLNLPMPCLKFLCLNYNRGTLGQTGTGHFSPLAAYDAQTDSALILDVARFKYPPHWVSIDLLHQAMAERGFAILSPGTDLNSGAPALGSEHCVLKDFDEHGRKISKPAANCNCSC